MAERQIGPYFSADGHEAFRLTEFDAPEFQSFLESCDDYFELVEGRPTPLTAAVEELASRPPECSLDDLFCFGIRNSAGSIVGVLSAFRNYRRHAQWYVSLMLMSPAVRRNGLGRGVYLAFENWLRSCKADSVLLAIVDANQDAAKFWRSVGFSHFASYPKVTLGLVQHTLHEFEKLIA